MMLSCWAEDPSGEYFKKHLPRVTDYVWIGEDGIKMQSFGSQSWDCALVIQALLCGNLNNEFAPVLKLAHDFLKRSQVPYLGLKTYMCRLIFQISVGLRILSLWDNIVGENQYFR